VILVKASDYLGLEISIGFIAEWTELYLLVLLLHHPLSIVYNIVPEGHFTPLH